jgi:hypothetical protein
MFTLLLGLLGWSDDFSAAEEESKYISTRKKLERRRMALITSSSRCAICGELLCTKAFRATSGVFFPPSDPLYRFCDAPLHWDCYEDWPERLRFARQYVNSWVRSEVQDEDWGTALLTDLVYLAVRKKEPGEVAVWLFETGTRVSVPLSRWSAWLSDIGLTERPLHYLEEVSLRKVLPGLRRQFRTCDTVLAAVDWDAKERLAKARQTESARQEGNRLAAIQRHNDACSNIARTSDGHGLTCPHCRRQSNDIEFVDYAGLDRKSFFVCRACGRSFGHEL